MCLLDCMGGMMTTPSLLLRLIEDHNGGLSLSQSLLSSSRSVFLSDASPPGRSTTTTATMATTRARRWDDRAREMKARAHVGSILR